MGIKLFVPYKRDDDKTVKTTCGNYVITAMPMTKSDGSPAHTNADGTPCKCYGFHITHKEHPNWNLVYITDTMYCKYRFTDLKNLIIGTNYQTDKLEENTTGNRYFHTLLGHMSIDNTIEMLKASKPSDNVILAHLSRDNSDVENFIAMAQKVVKCPVNVAKTGLEINL